MTYSEKDTVSDTEAEAEPDRQNGGFPFQAAIRDRPAETDELGFAPYVNALKEYITHEETESPLTISVEGEWGTGKSSFMLQLKRALRKEDELTVQFNPWRHDQEEALWAAFAIEFFQQISDQLSIFERLFGYIKLLRYRTQWKDGWAGLIRSSVSIIAVLLFTVAVPLYLYQNFPNLMSSLWGIEIEGSLSTVLGTGGLALSIAGLLTLWIKIKEQVTDPIGVDLQSYLSNPDYQDRVSFINDFHDDFQNILDSYVGDEPVFIFIDDLDRCEVPKAAQLMQSINLMLNSDPRLVFIIGMDREKVAAGIAAKHDNILPYLREGLNSAEQIDEREQQFQGLEFGYEYLEKFIQIPFLVPQPTSEDIEEFITALSSPTDSISNRNPNESNSNSILDNQLNRDSEEVNEIIKMVAPALRFNPRTIKKFINLFRLRALLANKNGLFRWKEYREYSEGDITLPQLGKFVAISLQWPRLLSLLSSNPEVLDELQQLSVETREDTDVSPSAKIWARREKLLELLRIGCENEDGEKYSLANANIDHLLQISPRIDQPTKFEGKKEKRFNQLTEHVKREQSEVDPTFPWLPFSRSEWKVPCPGCGRQIHNTKSAFESHWTESNRCNGVSESELDRIFEMN